MNFPAIRLYPAGDVCSKITPLWMTAGNFRANLWGGGSSRLSIVRFSGSTESPVTIEKRLSRDCFRVTFPPATPTPDPRSIIRENGAIRVLEMIMRVERCGHQRWRGG